MNDRGRQVAKMDARHNEKCMNIEEERDEAIEYYMESKGIIRELEDEIEKAKQENI